MSPHPTARIATRSTIVAALLVGSSGCDELATAPSSSRPSTPAYKLGDGPGWTIPGPLDVTPQPPPPSIQ